MLKILTSFLLFLIVLTSIAQTSMVDSLRSKYDQLYGLDMLLYNGEKYTEEVKAIEGHPFWLDQPHFKGTLYIKGNIFENQKLRFNLNKEEFILLYTDYNLQPYQIILNNAWIDSIKTENVLFIKNVFTEIPHYFLQILYNGRMKCLIGREKKLNFQSQGDHIGYHYSNEIKQYYLVIDEKVNSFNRNKNFLRIFPKDKRRKIRQYMTSNRIKIKKISDDNLKKLVVYCEYILK